MILFPSDRDLFGSTSCKGFNPQNIHFPSTISLPSLHIFSVFEFSQPRMDQPLYLRKAFVAFLRNQFSCSFAGQKKVFAGVSCKERNKMQTGPELWIISVIYKLAKEDTFILISVTASWKVSDENWSVCNHCSKWLRTSKLQSTSLCCGSPKFRFPLFEFDPVAITLMLHPHTPFK